MSYNWDDFEFLLLLKIKKQTKIKANTTNRI